MIYKNKFSLGFAFLAASLAVVSCSDDDTLKDVRGFKPTVKLNTVTAQAAEGDDITFTLTVDTPLSADMNFKLELVDEESTASFRDFTTSGEETDISGGGGYGQGKIGYALVFPAYATTFSFTVTPSVDLEVEGNEVIKLLLRPSENSKGLVAAESRYITINVADDESGDIAMRLVWDGATTDDFGTIHPATYPKVGGGDPAAYTDYDFDVYVYDENFNAVDDNQAATGDSPENLRLVSNDLADGQYLVAVDLYARGPAAVTPFTFTNMNLQVAKLGTWSQRIPLTFTSGSATGEVLAAILTKTGSTYTLADANGAVLASGRNASSFNSKLQMAVAKSRLNK